MTQNNKNTQSRSPVILIMIMIIGIIIGLIIGKSWQVFEAYQSSEESSKQDSDKDGNKEDSENKKIQTVLTVESIYPKSAKVPVSISAEGTIVASNQAMVSAKISGVAIEQVLVNEGDWVKKGQPLAIFDTQGLTQQAIQANANVIKAKTAFGTAKSDVERVEPLLKINAISVQDYERYLSQAKQAEADLVATQAMFESQNIKLNNATVVAPVTGIISQKNAQVGSVPQGSLFTIIEEGDLEWEAEVNTKDLVKIKRGTEVVVNTISQQRILGKVIRINPVIGNNRQAKVRAVLQVPKKQLTTVVQAGMLLSGEFLLAIEEQQLVPISAVVNSDGYDHLMLIDKIYRTTQDKEQIVVGTINKQKVELGEQFNDVVVVKTQLSPQQAIVQQGGSFLNNGDLVRVLQPPTIKAPMKAPMQAPMQAPINSAVAPSTSTASKE